MPTFLPRKKLLNSFLTSEGTHTHENVYRRIKLKEGQATQLPINYCQKYFIFRAATDPTISSHCNKKFKDIFLSFEGHLELFTVFKIFRNFNVSIPRFLAKPPNNVLLEPRMGKTGLTTEWQHSVCMSERQKHCSNTGITTVQVTCIYQSNENTNLMQHCAGSISAGSLYMFRAQAPIIRSI